MTRSCLAALVLALLPRSAHADVRLPAILSDGAVLQRDREVTIWGWAAPGERVRVSGDWFSAGIEAQADESGRFETSVRTLAAGGPHVLRIRGANEIELHDLWFGEVWIASGQSNMEWPLASSDLDSPDLASLAASLSEEGLPPIREFELQNAIKLAPADDCVGRWKQATAKDLGGFSAVGFFFARALARELGVPLGIVASNWGGTPAEAWTSAQTLASFPEWTEALERIEAARTTNGDLDEAHAAQLAAFWQRFDELDPGIAERWMTPGFDDGGWMDAELPSTWAGELDLFDGAVWYRRVVEIPADWAGQAITLALGPIDDMDRTYWNGVAIGAHEEWNHWQTPRHYKVPSELVQPGRAVIVVRAVDTGGLGGLNGEDDALHLQGGAEASRLPLAGTWKWKRGPSTATTGIPPSTTWFDANQPTSLYNGMIAPLLPFEIRGAIWYQGESNRDRAVQYRRLFPAMIEDWRARFGQGDFPFYFVQIAPFEYGGDRGEAAELREAQLFALATPNTGMAVTMDIGNPTDIHPRNKKDVGERLSRWALKHTYGRADLVESGPLYRSMQLQGRSIRISFDHASGGLVARGGALTHFEMASADRVFHPAQATIDGASIVVSSAAVEHPQAVRFAWTDAAQPNLFNSAGLPASSFRTDDWPAVSRAR